MQGNFTLGLLEIFAYLIPGGIALMALLYQYLPLLADRIQKDFWSQIIFLVCSYVFGHLLTVVSVIILKLREIIKKIRKPKWREERLSFYLDLRNELYKLFGSQITRSDEYLLALRLVADNLPKSIQEIDRLYALTLFSRNIVVSFIIIAAIFLMTDMTIFVVSVILSILFFVRYTQIESAIANTVFRSAYVYLRTKEQNKTSDNLSNPDYQPSTHTLPDKKSQKEQ